MIRDLQLMKNILPLFEKKIAVWGIGNKGRRLVEEIKAMGGGKNGIFLCDSNPGLWGECCMGHTILSPNGLQESIAAFGSQNIVFLVTVISMKAQDEILKRIEELYGDNVDVCTENAVEAAIYLNLMNPCIDGEYRKKKLVEHEINRLCNDDALRQKEDAFKYFSFLPLHEDEIIIVYQKGKVASSSVYYSIKKYNRNVLHSHTLAEIGNTDEDLSKLLNLKSGKIITLVRDPVARRISEMWQNISNWPRYSVKVDFNEIEQYYFKKGFEKGDMEWFDEQIKRFFKINIFDYPFDIESGYSIVKQGNIEILLIKMEKLSELEDVRGEFLGIKDFKLQKNNIGEEKPYRFALQEYKKSFSLSQEELENIYYKFVYTRYFYSEEERRDFYNKWVNKQYGQGKWK